MRVMIYRDYTIRYGFNLNWFAHIYRPGSPLIMTEGVVEAPLGEGETVVLNLAKARVDEEEATRGP